VRLAAALLLAAALPSYAQMYKCVDERGVTHYSDKPRPGCKGGQLDIRAIPPPSGKERAPAPDAGGAEREFQRRQIERARAEEADARKQEAQKRRCAALRQELGFLRGAGAIFHFDDKGNRVYLEDKDRARRTAELEAEVARACR
jgi:hypothetical protein